MHTPNTHHKTEIAQQPIHQKSLRVNDDSPQENQKHAELQALSRSEE